MGTAHRSRKAVLVFIILGLAVISTVLLVRGCRENRREALRDRSEATRAAADRRQPASPADASGASAASADEDRPVALAPAQAAPEQDPDDIVPVEEATRLIVNSITALPSHPASGGAISFRAVVYGEADDVTVSISGPGGAFTVALARGSSLDDAGASEWIAEVTGPTIPGRYDYSATATGPGGATDTASGEGGFTVEGQ